MIEIKVEKDEECNLEIEIKVENVETFERDLIFARENSSVKNCPVSGNAKGINFALGKGEIVKIEDQKKLLSEIKLEKDLFLSENSGNFAESSGDYENENRYELITEIKVEEEIQISELKDSETRCFICKAKITNQTAGALCDFCEKIENSTTLSSGSKIGNHSAQQSPKTASKESKRSNLCLICGKQSSSYLMHLKTHKNDDIACFVCSKPFKYVTLLREHYNKCHPEQHFECSVCRMRCPNKNDLLLHMEIHKTERPFSCNLCSLRFKKKLNLQCHKTSVHGDKNSEFKCRSCQTKYKSIYNLMTHINVYHRSKKPNET